MSNTTLFLLTDDIKKLEDVKQKILSMETNELIKHVDATVLQNMNYSEKYFCSKWKSYSTYDDVCTIRLPDNSNLNFLVKEAYIETSRRQNNMFDVNGNILPKQERTLYENTKVVFFERENRVYMILFTTATTSINKIKQRLLDNKAFLDTITETYRIDDDLFYWLFYKHNEKDGLISQGFEVQGISGFTGNIMDEHNIIKGESEMTPSLLVTKAFVIKFHPIRSLSVILKLDDYNLNFLFNDSNQCSIGIGSFIPIRNGYETDVLASIIIYSYIIPLLLSLFKNDKEWTSDEKSNFGKRIGEEVIRDIADFHKIDLKAL